MVSQKHTVDFCVVGGGVAGLAAAVAAARGGLKVALMQDRPVLGGNASSEIRMWVCGAHGRNNRETGLVEEILLENRYRNPAGNWSVWDSVLYEKVRFEPNITLLLNCSCCEATMDGPRIRSIRGWQTTTQTWHTVTAPLFADCSGDSVLAPLVKAEFRLGREAAGEFNEDIEPPVADRKTMGMSCLIQARRYDHPRPFIPPAWANVYESDAQLPNRNHAIGTHNNFWWIELGGEDDSIHDTERIRDELLKVAFGVWDHIKNRGDHGAENWDLEWVGFLPGKRESRRYVGDHILTQNDVRAEGRFDDLVAYGGWSMDDHHPAGLRHPGEPTIFHPAPAPFGIPYRCLYSRNVENLFFAGRNISTTHAALSSTRVMATCATLGQAVGTAAVLASLHGVSPRGLYQHHVDALKQRLMEDDCYLPWNRRQIPAITTSARLTAGCGDPAALRNGFDRPIGDVDNGWTCPLGGWVMYEFDRPTPLHQARIIFDSQLDASDGCRLNTMPNWYAEDRPGNPVPPTMVRGFRLEIRDQQGIWQPAVGIKDNYQRLVRTNLEGQASAVRLIPTRTWGCEQAQLFAFDVR